MKRARDKISAGQAAPSDDGRMPEFGGLRLVLDHVPAFVWKYDPARRRILFASDYVRELSGLDSATYIQNPGAWFERMGGDEESLRARAAIDAAMNAGEPFDQVYRFNTLHRGPRWFQVVARPVQEDGELFYYGCTTDVTERRAAEDECAGLAAALEQADEAFILTALDGKILYVNPAFERMTGYSRQETLGKKPSLLKSGRQDEAFYQDLWRTIAGGRPWRGRFVNRRKDGSFYEQWATITPLCRQDGRVEGYVSVQMDMSAQAELERRLARAERLASVGETISGAAHTIKNIMNTLNGSAYLVDKALHSRDVEQLGVLWGIYSRNTERLETLTRRMLDFVRAEDANLEPLDLNDLGREVVSACRASAAQHDVVLIFAPEDGLACIPCDRAAMHDAVLNLVGNAIEACAERGGGRVRLATSSHADEGVVELTVEDDGPGIPQEVLDRLFQPFVTTKGHKGNGLGLAMVQKTVQAHRGTIEVASKPGRTCFSIRLPL